MSALFALTLIAQSRSLVLIQKGATSLEHGLSAALWIGMIALGGFVLNDRFQTLTRTEMAEANYRSLPVRDKTPEERELIYQDWLRVCGWVEKNTPEDGLWLTPRHQQTFIEMNWLVGTISRKIPRTCWNGGKGCKTLTKKMKTTNGKNGRPSVSTSCARSTVFVMSWSIVAFRNSLHCCR
jgi:hypothetical protein